MYQWLHLTMERISSERNFFYIFPYTSVCFKSSKRQKYSSNEISSYLNVIELDTISEAENRFTIQQ